MTPLVAVALAGGAVAGMLIVHALYRGARRRVTVASLKPFEAESRPRLTLAPLTERALLACRVALVVALAGIVVHEQPDAVDRALRGDVVAVVPGTRPPEVAAGARYVWLDGVTTPLDRTPRSADVTAGALLSLVQTMDVDARLTVSGALPAPGWPAEMPAFGRPITWRDAPAEAIQEAGWRAAGGPGEVAVAGDDPALVRAVLRSISLWRDSGLLPDDVVVTTDGTDGDAARVDIGAGSTRSGAWHARVVGAADAGPDVVVYDAAEPEGVFATALWHALTRPAGMAPVAGVSVLPLPRGDALQPVAQGNVARRTSRPVAPVWLALAVLLFAAERGLAARGVGA